MIKKAHPWQGRPVNRQRSPASQLLDEISAVAASLGHAGRGLVFAILSQRNLRIHVLVGLAVLSAGLALELSRIEMVALVLTVALVVMGELLNTGLELTLNVLEARDHPIARAAKDAAAGGVLLAVIGSVAVGLLILGPRLLALFKFRCCR